MPSHSLPRHKYATRANLLVPPMSPITPPIRPRPRPPVYDHPYSLGMEWGREEEIPELNLGEPRIPLEDATTHVVVRRGGETVVFGWEECWEVRDEWEAERLRVARAKRQKRARMGGMSRAARKRAWKQGPGRNRGEDGRFC